MYDVVGSHEGVSHEPECGTGICVFYDGEKTLFLGRIVTEIVSVVEIESVTVSHVERDVQKFGI